MTIVIIRQVIVIVARNNSHHYLGKFKECQSNQTEKCLKSLIKMHVFEFLETVKW